MVGDRALGRSQHRQHILSSSNGPVLLDTKPKPITSLEHPNFLIWGRCDLMLESWSVDRLELGKNCAHGSVPSCSHHFVEEAHPADLGGQKAPSS